MSTRLSLHLLSEQTSRRFNLSKTKLFTNLIRIWNRLETVLKCLPFWNACHSTLRSRLILSARRTDKPNRLNIQISYSFNTIILLGTLHSIRSSCLSWGKTLRKAAVLVKRRFVRPLIVLSYQSKKMKLSIFFADHYQADCINSFGHFQLFCQSTPITDF